MVRNLNCVELGVSTYYLFFFSMPPRFEIEPTITRAAGGPASHTWSSLYCNVSRKTLTKHCHEN